MAGNGMDAKKNGGVALSMADTYSTATAVPPDDQKKKDDEMRIRELLAKKAERERAVADDAAAAAAAAKDLLTKPGADLAENIVAANEESSKTADDGVGAKAVEEKSAAAITESPKNGDCGGEGVNALKEKTAVGSTESSKNGDDEARLREMLSKKKIIHKKSKKAAMKSDDGGRDKTSETEGTNQGRVGEGEKAPRQSHGNGRRENDSRSGGRDFRRDRPYGRGGYHDDRRRDGRGWRNDRSYGRGGDDYWGGRGGRGGWRNDMRDFGGRGGYHQERDGVRDRSRGRSRSRSFSRSSSGSRSYSSSDGSRSSGSYSSRSPSRSYSRSVSRSPSRDSRSETSDQKRKRSDTVVNEKKKHRRSQSNSSKSKSDSENALTKDLRTILVSQLVMKADDYDIRRYFKRKVCVKVNDVILLRDRRTGRHKGMAYVELGSLEDVDTALEVSGKTPDFQRFPILVKRTEADKNISCIVASVSGDSAFQLTPEGKRIEAQKVYVGSIDRAVTQAQLYTLFSQFGTLDNVLLQMDMATGISKGFAFLSYRDPKDANLAIQTMSGQLLAGRPLKTGWANQQTNAAGIHEIRSDEFPMDSNEKIQKVNQVLLQLTGSGLTAILSQVVDPSQQQALSAAGPAGALGILPSAQLACVADAALDLALGNLPSRDALSPVNGASPVVENPPVNAPAAASASPRNADDAKVVGRMERPSKYILVHNMFDKDEETEQGWEEDIKLDFEDECAQYGQISSVVVMSKEAGGKIYATFEAVDGAMNCAKNLAGRWFDKRQLRVEFVDSIPS